MPQVPKQRNITLKHNKQVRVKGTEKRAQKKRHATCLATLLQNELNSDVTQFTTQTSTSFPGSLSTIQTGRKEPRERG